MPKNIKLLEEGICKNVVYSGNAVNFNVDGVRLPNGKEAVREYIDHPGAVAVLPILEDGSIVFVRQFRYPIGEVTLELPAGKMHSKKDSPLKRAKCELAEETGYSYGRISKLLTFWPCCAFSNETLHIFVARDLRPGKAMPDEDEFLRVSTMSLDAAMKLVKNGKIKDSKTIIALQAYALEKACAACKKRK